MHLIKFAPEPERHPSPNEIYLAVEVSETTLKQDEGKKLLAYQDAGIPEVLDGGCCGEGSQDTPPTQNLL